MKGRWQLSSRTIHVVMLTAWALLWAGTFFTLLTGQTRLGLSDLSEQFHAFALYQARAMAEGRLPLWSNGSYGGFPFAADPQSATFNWPRWLTILASPRGTLLFFALELEALFHIWLSGALTYVLAFRETRHHLAALMGAVAFGLGGYLVAYPVLQLAILETITWLPLILFSLSRFAFSPAGKSANRWLAVASLALATAFSAGHPQTFLHLL